MTVEVEEKVFVGLEAALENDELNEYHHTDTRKWLFSQGFYPAAGWIGDNHRAYSRGLQEGFQAVEEETHEAQND